MSETLALVSDVHGNLPALEAVAADLERLGVERAVCLGDVGCFGPFPAECLRRVRDLGWPVVMGNTDAMLLEPRTLADVARPDALTQSFLAIESWSAAQLGEADRRFVRGFSPEWRARVEGLELHAFHGSPRSYDDRIHSHTPDEALDALFEEPVADVLAGGHTHEPFARRYRTGLFVNPGSVGLPFQNPRGAPYEEAIHPHHAEYALLEARDGLASVTLRRVPYDVAPLVRAVRERGMPHGAWWLEGWLRPRPPRAAR